MKTTKLVAVLVGASALLATACSGGSDEPGFAEVSGEVVNVYSSRHYDVDKEVYALFEEQTGIKLNFVEGKSGELVERILREQSSPQADVFLTVGAESIYLLNQDGVLADINSDVVESNIPAQFRGKGWMGMTSRARVIAYAKDRVDPASIETYQDLLKPEFKGKILVRSSGSSYNQALLASFVDLYGEEEAKQWAAGVTANFARDPKGNDINQAEAVAAGVGDLAIMNSYYYARMANSTDPEKAKLIEQVGLIFPKDTHLNISYAAVLNGAKHPENAQKLLEFLSGPEVQQLYAEKNGEFPLNPAVALPEMQASWGEFSTQQLDFETFGEQVPAATKIFDEVGWN
ncbi:MAG: Fe(3+) ABC transporter substrate-binding protein [Arachnia propionica]|nr:MAG: Fe(3+) ABC transporter substrate-binding protein [Arachnia propionica]